FTLGEPFLTALVARGIEPKWATLGVFLGFLSAFCDSHIAREHGASIAKEVREAAVHLRQAFERASNPAELVPELRAYDRVLNSRAINPGTSADLTAGTLFASRLRNVLPSVANNG